MRVTQKMMAENAVRHMDENRQKLQSLQEKIASGKQFQRASDNPSGATAALNLRSSLESNQAFLETVHVTDEWMAATDGALREMAEGIKNALKLAQSGVSDSNGPEQRAALAAEMNGLLEQAIDIANTTHHNSYLFAGYRTTTRPFEPVDTNGDRMYDTVNVNDNLSPEVILRSVGPNQTIQQNVDGKFIFQDLFSALITARDELFGGNSSAIQATLRGLQDALNLVNEASTANGARQRQVRQIGDRLEKAQMELKNLLSLKEDANLAEAISNLRYQETVYQSVLEVGYRAISALNLFDLLS